MKVLSRWGLDVFLVLLAIGQTVVIMLSAEGLRVLGALLAAVSALVLIARRIQPLAASILSLLALGACLCVLPETPTLAFISLLTTFAIVAAINSTRDAVICWFVGAGVLAAAVMLTGPADQLGDYALTLALCSVMWIAGLLVSRRTRQAALVAMQLELAELEQEKLVQEERSRIARELHDVVSHGLTVVIVQTVAARSALEDVAAEDVPSSGAAPLVADAERHLASVESAAREALADMRRMLDLLQPDEGASDAPPPAAPRLVEVPALCDRAREAGLDVDDSRVDSSLALSQGLEVAVYRIVQEALTNSIKYAPGSRVVVTLERDGGDVCVEVADAGSAASARAEIAPGGNGRGLLGMRERAAAYGGTVMASRSASGGFTVRGRLPISREAGV
ncbi:histidine kinase [Microbacterium sp. KR10-403]|uniref:sensor histidine kinase n=1 Tax=Microbacterium sp. KR10-403 TaxID=3158581 RepID=UPI0032E3D368